MVRMRLDLKFVRKSPRLVAVTGIFGVMFLLALALTPRAHGAPSTLDPAAQSNINQAAKSDAVTPNMPSLPTVSARNLSLCPSVETGSGVTAELRSDLTGSVPSSIVGIYASLSNHNSYAAKDGLLLVRVSKKGINGEPDRVVDSFVALRGVDIAPNKITRATFEWHVPTALDSADYYLNGEYVFPNRPYLDPLVPHTSGDANMLHMPIKSMVQGSIYLDPSGTRVNNNADIAGRYVFARTGSAPVSVSLVNNTDIPYHGNIEWTLYEKAESPLGEPVYHNNTDVIAHPHTKVSEAITIPQLKGDVYYLEAHLIDGTGSRSIIGMPLVREGSCESSLFGSSSWVIIIEVLVLLILLLVGVGYFTRHKWVDKVFKKKSA